MIGTGPVSAAGVAAAVVDSPERIVVIRSGSRLVLAVDVATFALPRRRRCQLVLARGMRRGSERFKAVSVQFAFVSREDDVGRRSESTRRERVIGHQLSCSLRIRHPVHADRVQRASLC